MALIRRGHIWYTLCYTSRYRRVLTGNNHHVTLPAGIDQGYSSRSGVRVGAPLIAIYFNIISNLIFYFKN